MLKKIIFILVMSYLILPAMSEEQSQNFYVGTPPGFYDYINPDDVDEENELDKTQNQPPKENNSKQEDVIVPPTNVKPTKNYAQIYNELEVPTFSYLHNIDPDQYYDMKDTSWSVYPLLRLTSPIYFKTIK